MKNGSQLILTDAFTLCKHAYPHIPILAFYFAEFGHSFPGDEGKLLKLKTRDCPNHVVS